MRTKITVEIHKEGVINSDFLKMIAAHNEGKINANMQHFCGVLLHNKVEYPTSLSKAQYKIEGDTMHITLDNWESTTLSLTWKEIHELSEIEKEIMVETERGEVGARREPDRNDLNHVNI